VSIRNRLLRAYWAVEQRMVPGLQYSQTQYEAALHAAVTPGVRWLDIGCGRRVLPEWRARQEASLVDRAAFVAGIDMDLESLRDNRSISAKAFAPATALPFRDSEFDLVTANMVMEHVDEEQRVVDEAFRVLRPGGRFLFHTPNVKSLAKRLPDAIKRPLARVLDGRTGGDVFHTYYRFNEAARIQRCAQRSGFEVERLSHVSSTAIFATVLPLAVAELAWLRHIADESRSHYRSNIIGCLRKAA
jgi:2-polyprenyl-3-methyl-5-hydroxy-6-metoxy-1,4-benzoquinol methylase